jgi:hypothetical protein
MTVSDEIRRTMAVSSTVSPPKKRSSITVKRVTRICGSAAVALLVGVLFRFA